MAERRQAARAGDWIGRTRQAIDDRLRQGRRPSLSVVIPAYNEQERLPATLQALREFVAAEALECEVIVVDNGSSDGTSELVRGAAVDSPCLRLVRTEHSGKGWRCARAPRSALSSRGVLATMRVAQCGRPRG